MSDMASALARTGQESHYAQIAAMQQKGLVMNVPSFSQGTAPPLVLLGLEPLRAAWEYAHMRFMNPVDLPRGDMHTVIVFPGLASDRRATRPLVSFCKDLGYNALDWGKGFNTGPQGEPNVWIEALAEHVLSIGDDAKGDLSLVGWSLGGIYAREVAKRIPDRVRQVVTIGTPLAAGTEDTHAGLVYRLLNGQKPLLDAALRKQLLTAPSVPTTSIFSRTDGVVAWQSCLQPGHRRHTENVEVQGSHCGLGWNAQVLEILADRLAQPRGRWKRYSAARPTTLANTPDCLT